MAKALDDPRVAGAFEAAAGLAARQLFERDAGAFGLELGGVAESSIAAAEGVSAEELGISAEDLESARLELIESRAVLDALEFAEKVGWMGLILTPLGAVALLLSVGMARERPSAASFAGVAVAVAALLLAALFYVGREIVLAQFDDALTQDAVAAAWSAALGDLLTGCFIAAGAGALVALLAALLGSRRRPAYRP